jgi:hypothetical protein
MIPMMQKFEIRRDAFWVDLRTIPKLGSFSQTTLSALNGRLPAPVLTAEPLKERIASMEETAALLKKAGDKGFQNKMIAMIKTAVVVVLVFEAVTFSAKGTSQDVFYGALPAEILYGLVTYFLYYKAKKKIVSTEERLPDYSPNVVFKYDFGGPIVPMLGGGLLLPPFEAFTRVDRLARVLEEQRKSIIAELDDYSKQNQALLPAAYFFYVEQGPSLLIALNDLIEKCLKRQTELMSDPNRSKVEETELQYRLNEYNTTQRELSSVLIFYNKIKDALHRGANASLPHITLPPEEKEGEVEPYKGDPSSEPLLSQIFVTHKNS